MHTCIKRHELQSYATSLTILLPITSELDRAGVLSTPISPSQPFQNRKTTKVIHLLKIVKEFNVNTTDSIPIFKMPSEHVARGITGTHSVFSVSTSRQMTELTASVGLPLRMALPPNR